MQPAIAPKDVGVLLEALATIERKLRGMGPTAAAAGRLRALLEYTNGHLHQPEDARAAQAVLECWRGRRTTAGFVAALASGAPRRAAAAPHAVRSARPVRPVQKRRSS